MEEGFPCIVRWPRGLGKVPRRAGWTAAAAALLVCSFASLVDVSLKGIVTNGSLVTLSAVGGALAVALWGPHARRSNVAGNEQAVAEVRSELAALREENARLRLQAHRAEGVGQVAARVRRIVTEAEGPAEDEDESWKSYTEAVVMRTALVTACRDLQTALAHTERRLTTTIPGPELDRRIDRRHPPEGGAVATGAPPARAPEPVPSVAAHPWPLVDDPWPLLDEPVLEPVVELPVLRALAAEPALRALDTEPVRRALEAETDWHGSVGVIEVMTALAGYQRSQSGHLRIVPDPGAVAPTSERGSPMALLTSALDQASSL